MHAQDLTQSLRVEKCVCAEKLEADFASYDKIEAILDEEQRADFAVDDLFRAENPSNELWSPKEGGYPRFRRVKVYKFSRNNSNRYILLRSSGKRLRKLVV